MRFYDIVLFVFLFNVSVALLNNVGAFQVCEEDVDCTMPYSIGTDVETLNRSAGITRNESYSTQSIGLFDTITSIVWGFSRGLVILSQTFIQATIGVPDLMIRIMRGDPTCILSNSCGVVENIAFYISTIVYLVYIVGLVQFLAGRYFKTME